VICKGFPDLRTWIWLPALALKVPLLFFRTHVASSTDIPCSSRASTRINWVESVVMEAHPPRAPPIRNAKSEARLSFLARLCWLCGCAAVRLCGCAAVRHYCTPNIENGSPCAIHIPAFLLHSYSTTGCTLIMYTIMKINFSKKCHLLQKRLKLSNESQNKSKSPSPARRRGAFVQKWLRVYSSTPPVTSTVIGSSVVMTTSPSPLDNTSSSVSVKPDARRLRSVW